MPAFLVDENLPASLAEALVSRGIHAGVVCVRLPNRMAIDDQVAIVTSVITSLDPREVAGSLVVIEAGRVRLRRKSR